MSGPPQAPGRVAPTPLGRRRPIVPSRRSPTTRRWLRGRIIALARDAGDGAWVAYPEAIGEHPVHAVREAVMTLASEGLLEAREREDGLEARLPS